MPQKFLRSKRAHYDELSYVSAAGLKVLLERLRRAIAPFGFLRSTLTLPCVQRVLKHLQR